MARSAVYCLARHFASVMPFRSKLGLLLTIGLLQKGDTLHRRVECFQHRYFCFSSVSQTIQYISDLLKPLAQQHNLSLTSFGEAVTDPTLPYYGSIVLSDPWNSEWEPSPISPYKNSPAFNLLSGTIKGVYNAHRGLEGDDNIVVYPSYLYGNTGEGFTLDSLFQDFSR